jgi:serine phosphatase RsbU (regulator of sigma subunit)
MKLRISPAEREPFDFEMKEGSIVVGRSSTADLALADPYASRHHARLTRRGDSLYVEDLGARNGTFVDESLVVGEVEVRPGGRIKIAGSTIVHLDEGIQMSAVITRGSVTSTAIEERPIVLSAAAILGEESSDTVAFNRQGALRDHVGRLRTLRGMHRAFSRAIGRDELLRRVLDWASDLFSPRQAEIYLRGPDGEFRRAESRASPEAPSIPLPEEIVAQVLERGMAVAIRIDDAQGGHSADPPLNSLAAAPLLDAAGGSFGMVVLRRDGARPFTEDEVDLLVELAGEAALELRKIALAEEAEQSHLLDRELRLAGDIQRGILRTVPTALEGYSFEARNIPSRGVSGDFYSVTPRGDGEECVLIIADVSGKGFPAALLTFSVEALSAVMIEAGDAPADLCSKLSRQLFGRTLRSGFVTAFVATLDLRSGRLVYANAGQGPALLARSDGVVEELGGTGLPLAVKSDSVYSSREVVLEPDSMLLLYTDGISEAVNANDEEYGVGRLRACLARHWRASPPDLVDAIEDELDAFVGGVPYADDRTLLIVRRRTGNP